MIKKSVLLLLLQLTVLGVSATTYYARVSGNWATASTWSTSSCTGAASSTTPTASDNVVICSGKTVTMNANPGNCLSLTVNGTLNYTAVRTLNIGTGGLTLSNGASLTGTSAGILAVSGLVSVPAGASATLGGITLTANGGLTVSGTLTCNNTGGTKTFAFLTLNSGSTFSSTVAETYAITGNLTTTAAAISGGTTSSFTVGGDFVVNSGTTNFNAGSINVSGSTTVSGNLTWGGTTGTKTLNDITINTGGTWNNSASESFTVSGSISNSGTFTAGNSSTYTCTGTGKTFSGTLVIRRLTINGSYTNNGTITCAVRFRGSGTLTQGASSTLNITCRANRFTLSALVASATGNTVNYGRSGGVSNQTVKSVSGGYYNLTASGAGTKTLAAATTVLGNLLISGVTLASSNNALTVGGNFTNNGTYTQGTSTVTMNGGTAQSIGGTTATTFYKLSITNTASTVTAATNFSVSNTLAVSSNAVLAPGSTIIISGTGTLNGTGTVRVTRIASTPDFLSQYTIANKTLSGLTVDYTGAGNQNVNALNYGSLSISTNGTRTVTFPSSTVGVSNVFSPTAITTSYVITGNTVNFNGTIAQTIPAFNYNNLTSSSSGSRTLAATGTIGVAAVFTVGTNAYTTTGSTVNFNGTSSQTIPAFNYYNLTSSSSGARVLASTGTVGVAGAFTPGTNGYTITNNTMNFNGSGGQSIPAFTYNNLVLSGSGSETLSGNIIVNTDLTITSNLDVSSSNYSINIQRNWIKNGSFTAQNGTVTFDGAQAQTLAGSGSVSSFENLVINNTSGGVKLISGSYQVTGALTMNNGNFNANGITMTLVSTASKTARIAPVAGTASISGNFVVQRFLSSRLQSPTASHWSDLASPVQASTMADWGNELYFSYPHTPPTIYSNVLAYDETLDDYVGVTAATALAPGQGFEISLTDDASLTAFSNTTLTTVGVPNQGTQNLSSKISYNNAGNNLVGNPFASSVAWNAIYSASSGIMNTYDEFDCNAGTYTTFGAGSEIGAGQGFWVYTTSPSATLIVPESAKTTSSNSSVRSMDLSMFALKLSYQNENLPLSHTLKIGRADGASNDFDENDHPFRKSPMKAAPSITCMAGDKELSWDMLNSDVSELTLPLITRVGTSGDYTLAAMNTAAFADFKCITLEDKFSAHLYDLKSESVSCTMNVSDSPNRFVLHLSKSANCMEEQRAAMKPADISDLVTVSTTEQGSNITCRFSELQHLQIEVIDLLGQEIIPLRELELSEGTVELNLPDSFSGIYLIKISGTAGDYVQKCFKR